MTPSAAQHQINETRACSHLQIPLDVRNVLEQGDDDGHGQHEADGKRQRPRQSVAGDAQSLLHVEVEPQLHHDGPAPERVFCLIMKKE